MTDIDKTLEERGSSHGDFREHFRVAMRIKGLMRQETGWLRLTDVQKHALDVIADKQARILTGNPSFHDHWHDIQGYAALAAKEILEKADLPRPHGYPSATEGTLVDPDDMSDPPGESNP